MAIYGNEKWVSAWNNQQIYLDRSLIEKKGINYDEISLKAAEFLGEFSGVRRVVRNRKLLTGEYDTALSQIRNGVYFERSGDFYIEIQPGWNIRNNDNERDLQVRYGTYKTTLAFFGSGVKPQKIMSPVSSEDIAPTLSKVFRIRPPNANEGSILQEMER